MAARPKEEFKPTNQYRRILSRVNLRDPESISSALKLIRSGKSLRSTAASIDDEGGDDIERLLEETLQLNKEIRNLRTIVDSGLEDLIADISLSINSYPTAILAINHYDMDWFQAQPNSNQAKTRIAAALIRYVSKYTNLRSSFWEAIRREDSNMLKLISYVSDDENEEVAD